MKEIILPEKCETMHDFLVQNKDIVFDAVLDSIEDQYWDKTVNTVNILRINSKNKDSTIALKRKEWIKALKSAEEYFSKPYIEAYEKCHRCLKIIKYLEGLD